MNLENLKDPLFVSLIFFIVASDWFDNWLKDLFPSLRDTNPLLFNLLKTLVFALLYWLYKTMFKSSSSSGN